MASKSNRDDDSYFFKRTRYFVVDSLIYWEHELPRFMGQLVVGKRRFDTVSELQAASQRWDTGLAFQRDSGGFEDKYTKPLLQSTLYYLYKNGSSTFQLGRRTLTRRRLEELLDLLETDSDVVIYHSGDVLDVGPRGGGKGPSSAVATTSLRKKEPVVGELVVGEREGELAVGEREEDELGGDEMLHRIVDNLQSKMMAVRRFKEVSREVRDLRVLLAEKEEDLKECERVVQLEAKQV